MIIKTFSQTKCRSGCKIENPLIPDSKPCKIVGYDFVNLFYELDKQKSILTALKNILFWVFNYLFVFP